MKSSITKQSSKRKLWTPGPYYSIQLPQAGYELRPHLLLSGSGSAILLPYLLLENVYILYTPLKPLSHYGCMQAPYDRMQAAYARMQPAYDRMQTAYYDRMQGAYDRMQPAYDRMHAAYASMQGVDAGKY